MNTRLDIWCPDEHDDCDFQNGWCALEPGHQGSCTCHLCGDAFGIGVKK